MSTLFEPDEAKSQRTLPGAIMSDIMISFTLCGSTRWLSSPSAIWKTR
jgi:hypothetical protein